MKTRVFNSDKDVRAFWLSVREVPARIDGRTIKQYERYYLGLYLLALADHGLLSYPLKAEEGESPDFMLTWKSGQTTGLEITRATDQELQSWMSRAEKENPESSLMIASPSGYTGDQLEEEWCRLVRETVTKKVENKIPKYRPASRYDLLLPDDTRTGAGDRRKVVAALSPWVRELKQSLPKLGKISAVTSLDILYDVGGDSLILPYIGWSAPDSQQDFSERVEHAGRIATAEAIRSHKAAGAAIYSMDSRGRLIKETVDGRRFEVRVLEDGEEVTLRELSRG